MSDDRRPMMITGILHIVVGIVQPVLWGISWAFTGYYSTVVSEVWGSVAFFIPTGVLAILVAKGNNRGLAIASLIMSILSAIVALVIFITNCITAGLNFSNYFAAHGAFSILALLLGIFEIAVSIVTSIYSSKIYRNAAIPTQAMTVQATTAYPSAYPAVQQYPGPQAQAQYPGPQAEAQQYPPQEQKY
ncbi:uncharacterized protein LOC110984572 [Acanthaster planci]|uniref:Uncharacterized protein LOC110984572 n=1 Tax=Acanthaster planci TaxID=133434 RepID=A0A8B7Z6J6_ACAPL|nr:uncharacterized protein LOC110984572 [Acanthaster planci]